MPREGEFLDQALDSRDLVSLVGVFQEDMPEHQAALAGQSAQNLSGLPILEAIEAAAQGFAIQGHAGQRGGGLPGESRGMGRAVQR